MLKSKFFKNLAAYSIADILGKSILLLLSPVLTRLLTPSQYGSIPLLMAAWAILSILQFGGFDFAFQMFRAQTLVESEREQIRVTATKMAALFLFCFWLLITVFALSTDVFIDFANVTRLELLFFLLAIIPSSLAYWSIFVFRFMHLALPYVRINLLNKVASVLIAVPFMMAAKQEDRLLVMLAVIFVAQTLSLFWVYYEYRKINLTIVSKEFFSKPLAKKMFKFGIVFFPSSLIYSSSVYIDRMIMGYFSTTDQVAVLGLAVSLASGILMIKAWFSMVWDPQLLEWLATKNPKLYVPKLQAFIPVLAAFFFSLAILAKLWSKEVIEFVYPIHFSEVASLVPFLVMAGGFSVLTLIAIASAIIENSARFRLQIYTMALLVNVVVAILLIPRIGLKGAAIGTLFGEAVILLSWIIIGKYFFKNLNLKWSSALFISLISFIFISFYEPGNFLNTFIERGILTGLLFIVLAYVAMQSKIYALLKSKL